MTTRQTSIQLDETTEALIAFLSDRGFGKQTNIIREAIKRMAEQVRQQAIDAAAQAADNALAQSFHLADEQYRRDRMLNMDRDAAEQRWERSKHEAQTIRDAAIERIKAEYA